MKSTLLAVVMLSVLFVSAGPLLGRQPTSSGQPVPAPAKYACPMKCESEKTYDQAGRCPVCKMKLKPVQPAISSFSLERVGPAEADLQPMKPLTLALQLSPMDKAKPAGSPASWPAGARLHMVVASEDLSWMAHERVGIAESGAVEAHATFPHPGQFVVLAVAESAGEANEVAPLSIRVPGVAPAPAKLPPPAESSRAVQGGYAVTIKEHPQLKVGVELDVVFAITLDGKPLDDLQPVDDSKGTLIIISQNLATWSYRVAERGSQTGSSSKPAGGGANAGPGLTFKIKPAAPGLHAAWLNFRHSGKDISVPFTLEVKP